MLDPQSEHPSLRPYVMVRVGSDDHPATQYDIDNLAMELKAARDVERPFVAPHNVEIVPIEWPIPDDEIYVVCAGSDDRPASREDLESIQEAFDELPSAHKDGEGLIIVTHHAVTIQRARLREARFLVVGSPLPPLPKR